MVVVMGSWCVSKSLVYGSQRFFQPVFWVCLRKRFLSSAHSFLLPWWLPWYNCTGWLGVKHQLTYLLFLGVLCSLTWASASATSSTWTSGSCPGSRPPSSQSCRQSRRSSTCQGRHGDNNNGNNDNDASYCNSNNNNNNDNKMSNCNNDNNYKINK